MFLCRKNCILFLRFEFKVVFINFRNGFVIRPVLNTLHQKLRSVIPSWVSFKIISCAVNPLETSSAGFRPVSICRHWLGVDSLRINVILLSTNVRNLFSTFFMYPRTMVLSVHNTDLSIWQSSSRRIITSNFTDRAAADNLSLGIVVIFNGAKRELDVIKAQRTLFWCQWLEDMIPCGYGSISYFRCIREVMYKCYKNVCVCWVAAIWSISRR